MDTNKKLREHISALIDDALPHADRDLALAALQEKDGQQAWDVYHLIKDTLRATPAPLPSPGFGERLAERLAQEQALLPAERNEHIASVGAEPAALAAILSNPAPP